METGDLPEQSSESAAQKKLEELPLRELLPHWSNLLWRTSVRPWLQKMSQIDLSVSEGQILRHLQDRSLTIAEVAEYLGITHSAASRAVDRLVRDGFVNRTENPTDRRQKQLLLTPGGAALVENHSNTFLTGMERLVNSLPLDEQEQFRTLVAHLIAVNAGEAESTQTGDQPPAEKE